MLILVLKFVNFPVIIRISNVIFLKSTPLPVILMTGQGGVGKTSVAAATGLRCAELGYKTRVLITVLAHSLAVSVDLELGHDPWLVRPHLWGAELDALMELEGNWGAVKRYITQVLQARGLDGVQAEE